MQGIGLRKQQWRPAAATCSNSSPSLPETDRQADRQTDSHLLRQIGPHTLAAALCSSHSSNFNAIERNSDQVVICQSRKMTIATLLFHFLHYKACIINKHDAATEQRAQTGQDAELVLRNTTRMQHDPRLLRSVFFALCRSPAGY